jgi:hypothetical protein
MGHLHVARVLPGSEMGQEPEYRAAPNEREQVLRFAVGSPEGLRSRVWRLWVPPRKSDVYLSERRLGSEVKVRLHEPGLARFALTSEHLARPDALRLPEGNPRGGHEWARARPRLPDAPMARALAILIPWDEVTESSTDDRVDVTWIDAPAEGSCIEFDVIYTATGLTVEGHPAASSMGGRGRRRCLRGRHAFRLDAFHYGSDTEPKSWRSAIMASNARSRMARSRVVRSSSRSFR